MADEFNVYREFYKHNIRPVKEKRLRRFHENIEAITDLSECWNIKIKILHGGGHIQILCEDFLANYYPSTETFYFQKPKLLPSIIVAPQNFLFAFLSVAKEIAENPDQLYNSWWGFEKKITKQKDILKVGNYLMPQIRGKFLELCSFKENLIKTVNPREFEHLVAELLTNQGYKTIVTKTTRDNGKDIIAVTNKDGKEFIMLVECKKWLEQNVGIDIIQRIVGVKYINQADHSMVITTARFTSPAVNEAKKVINELSLIDGEALREWIKVYTKGSLPIGLSSRQ